MAKIAVMVGWDDVPHLNEEAKVSILAGVPMYQRQSRSKGIPQLGAGAIYQIAEEDVRCAPFEIPKHYFKSYALDVGWNRTAALWFAEDRDTNTAYIYDEYYRGQAEPSVHAAAIKQRGEWIHGVIDPAAHGRAQKDGEQLFEIYTAQLGLDLENADNGREAGIAAVWERLSQGRLKVFASCANWFAEYRLYRRDERGQIVKKNDHLMDDTRYGVMSGLSRGRQEPAGRLNNGKPWFHISPPTVWSG